MARLLRGLRMQSVAMPQTYVEAFSGFLQNEDYTQYARDVQTEFAYDSACPPSLLDIIQVWMCSGEATSTCDTYDTYEAFLLAVIGIIDWWSAFGKTEIVGGYLWPDISDGKKEAPRSRSKFFTTTPMA